MVRWSLRLTAVLSSGLCACASSPGVRAIPSGLATPRARPTASAVAVQGVAHLSGRAPLIVQVENSDASRPQSGLSAASVIYEYVAEGGVSRFSAIYPAAPAGQVGPVRSARLATLELLRLYGGVLAYSGAGGYVQGLLDASGLPHLDEDSAGGNLFRVGFRQPPHNLYSDGPHLSRLLGMAHAPPISYAYWPPQASSVPQGTEVATFRVPVSASENPTWTWNARLHGWTRSEPSTGPVVDAVTGAPLVATTVILQQVRITIAPQVVDVNGVHGVDHLLTSGGAAQIFSGGQEHAAAWSQPAAGPPRFTLAGGQAAPIVPGLIFIELVATGSTATIG